MNTRRFLAKAIEVVTLLLAAFGHFLYDIAPPDDVLPLFAVGVGGLSTVVLLLWLSALAKRLPKIKFKRRWLIASAAFFVMAAIWGSVYYWQFTKLTFAYPPENPTSNHLRGSEWTDQARQYRREHPEKTPAEIVADFGDRNLVWTAESIAAAGRLLTGLYILFVFCTAGAICCVTEGILVEPKGK